MTACKVPSCSKPTHTRGWCAAHYQRVIRTGSDIDNKPLGGKAKTPIQRIEDKSSLVPFCGCKIWFGASVPAGYGVLYYQGRQQYAHRVAWQLQHGPIPPGLFVLHRCDTPECINVNHLFLGTAKDNADDMGRKGRAGWHYWLGKPSTSKGKPSKLRGATNPASKLTSEDVTALRSAYASGEFTQAELADRHGIRQGHVSRIVRGESWA